MSKHRSILVRKAQIGDLTAMKALADANRHALGFVLRATLEAGVSHSWVLVAEVSDAGPIGFLHYRHRRDDVTVVYQVCVDESHRRRGVGRALLSTLMAEAGALDKACIRLKAPRGTSASEFYTAVGFARCGTEPGRKRPIDVWKYSLDGEGHRA